MNAAAQEPTSPPSKRDRALGLVRRATALFTIWSYTFIAPMGAALFAALAFLWRRDPEQRIRRLQRLTAFAYRFFHDWMRWVGLLDFDPRAPIAGLPEGPAVVIANHPTLADVTAVTARLGGGFTIVKPALYRRRLLHGMLSASGHIEGRGATTDHAGTQALVERAVERLGQGLSLVVFPEGTRSPRGGLHPFGRAPFEIAVRAGVPLVALRIESDPPYLTKEVSMYRPPAQTSRLSVELLGVYRPDAGSSRALRKRVAEDYRHWLAGSEAPEAGAHRAAATAAAAAS